MCRKLICLISFAVLLSIVSSARAVPFSTKATQDGHVSNDSQSGPGATGGGTGVHARNYVAPPTYRRRAGYMKWDISAIKARGGVFFSNVSLSNVGHSRDGNGNVAVYGIIETLDNSFATLNFNSLTWNSVPGGVQNNPTPPLNSPVQLDMADLVGPLLTFHIPNAGVRESTSTSQALADFLNSDTDGIAVLLFAPASADPCDGGVIRAIDYNSTTGTFIEGDDGIYPGPALQPNPADNATIVVDTTLTLSWKPGLRAAQHDIYFGSNWADVNDANCLDPNGSDKVYKARQNVDANSYPVNGPYLTGINYYWRIDEVNDPNKRTGSIWSFRILPRIAWDPTPPDGAGLVAPKITLRWKAGAGATRHYVHFGTSSSPPLITSPAYLPATSDPNWSPYRSGITLGYNTTYYWQIDESNGVTTYPGDVWQFTTIPNAPPDPNLVGWWRFDNDANDSSGHWYHGAASSDLSPPVLPTYVDDLQLYTGGREISLAGNNYKQYVDLPIGTLISSLTSSTFAMWVNVRASGSGVKWQKIFDFGTSTTNEMRLLPRYSNSPSTHFEITTGGVTNRVSWGPVGDGAGGTVIPLNEWHHVAVTISEPAGSLRTYRLYVDGTQVGINTTCTLTPSSLNPAPTSNWLGKSIDLTIGGLYIESYLDDFRIYDRELSQAKIVKIASPLEAWNPDPADNATNVKPTPTLTWRLGNQAAKHDVYFSNNWDAVNEANSLDPSGPNEVYKGQQDPNKYDITTLLEFETTYYWRIDEVNLPNMWPGSIWSFTTGNYLIVDDFEDYNNSFPKRIWDPNGWIKGGGGTVGNPEMTIIHGGGQSMPFDYNNLKSFYDSNATRTFATDQNWAAKGVKALSLWLRGYPPVGSFTKSGANPNYIYTMTASGTDINAPNSKPPEGFHDEFHYAYMLIPNTDYVITAKVNSISNTNSQSKAGLMIRDSLADNCNYAMMYITPGSGVGFQRRDTAGGVATTDTNSVPRAPYWIRLARYYYEGSIYYNAYYSSDNVNWLPLGEPDMTIIVTGGAEDYIGLAVTARDAAATCTAVFSNVSVIEGYIDWDGSIVGEDVTPSPWTSHQDISVKSNTAAPLYVTLQDSTSPTPKTITHPDPNIALQSTWQEWDIALSRFTGVDLTKIKKITIGIGPGNKIAHQGAGTLYFDDIKLYIPRCILSKRSADLAKADYIPAAGDCTVDYQELGTMLSDWLRGTVSTDEEIWLEAENANTMGPLMQVYSDRADASGGEYIAAAPGTPSEPDNPNANGIATYNFTVNGGVYKVLGRVVAPSGTEDSFWYRIPGPGVTTQITPPNPDGWIFWDVSEGVNNWTWDELNSDPNGDATVQFTMSAGTHTLEIAYRERTLLDCLLITDDLGLDQATLPPWGADLNGDKRIDIKDFALLAKQWLIEQLWP